MTTYHEPPTVVLGRTPAHERVASPPSHRPPEASAPPQPGATACPRRMDEADLPPEFLRNISTVHRTDVLALLGASTAALSSTLLLFGYLAPFSGRVGFVAVAFALFLGFYGLLVSVDQSGPAVRDRVVAALVHGLALLLLIALVFVIVYTYKRAADVLGRWNFYTEDLQAAGPLEPLEIGGIWHAVVGTLWMIAIALVITIPLGIAGAVYLNEIRGPFSRFVRTIVEAMTALPSILAGLFIYATWIILLGNGKSGFAAALALSVMMLPIIIRAADVVLRLVPGNLKEAGYALGAGHWRTVWHVTLPTARSGLATAVILGTARGIGETSPVLLTAGFTAAVNFNPLNGPMISLPLATFELVKSGFPNPTARGFGAGATLLGLVLILFIAARVIGGRGPGSLTKRQQRQAVAESRKDAERFASRAPSAVHRPDVAPDASTLKDPRGSRRQAGISSRFRPGRRRTEERS